MASCGAASPSTSAGPILLPIELYLPEGAHFVVIARPDELMGSPGTRSVIDALVPSERFDAFRAFNGIDPRTLTGLAYGEYSDEAGRSLGTVLAIRGPFHARVAVGEMAHRMMPVESESDEPYYRRAGIYGSARRDAIALDDHTLLLITGQPSLSRGALALTEPRALEGDGAALLASLDAPLVVLWPRPLGLPPGTDLALIFARERALGVSFADAPAGIALTAEARGEFPPGIEDNIRALFASLARSDMGHHLGMTELERTLQVALTAHGVRAAGDLSSATLARGLRDLLMAELPEIMAEIGPPPAPPSGPSDSPSAGPSTGPRSAP